MRIFITGGTGHIGSAVVSDLLDAGHKVIGLARSDKSAAVLASFGAESLKGDINEPGALERGARDADGVIHLASSGLGTGPNPLEKVAEEESRAVDALLAALRGAGKALVIAGGTPATLGRASTEEDPNPLEGPFGGRARNAQRVLAAKEEGVRSAVVRLPRSVHGRNPGDGYGFAGVLIKAARATGVSGYVGNGEQRWPAVHRLDAARLFRLVIEQAAPGTIAHAVADEGDRMLELAEAIGRALHIPVSSVPLESFGFLGQAFARDQPSCSSFTRQHFAWTPKHPSLLEDLEAGNYPE